MGAASDPDLEFHADRVGEVTDDEYVAVTQDTFVEMAIDEFRRSNRSTMKRLFTTCTSPTTLIASSASCRFGSCSTRRRTTSSRST